MFESNSNDSTGYKAYRSARLIAPVNDPLQLWVGERVRLKPMPENGVGEEFGIAEEYQPESQMFTVTVEDPFLDGDDDDGLREVPVEYAELAPRELP